MPPMAWVITSIGTVERLRVEVVGLILRCLCTAQIRGELDRPEIYASSDIFSGKDSARNFGAPALQTPPVDAPRIASLQSRGLLQQFDQESGNLRLALFNGDPLAFLVGLLDAENP